MHSEQWAKSLPATGFIAKYGAASAYSEYKTGHPAAVNDFEVEANLWWGDYVKWNPTEFRAP
ncbi:hypothetical protein [Sphaerisporangium dianthi]|uniref:Uncharacterized protein n=1 Tax=Sphaerisporangium dianthi TaxID=1436120 RepID=A0ABV9CBJ9_9ACTN